jgi:hypothetical protein
MIPEFTWSNLVSEGSQRYTYRQAIEAAVWPTCPWMLLMLVYTPAHSLKLMYLFLLGLPNNAFNIHLERKDISEL